MSVCGPWRLCEDCICIALAPGQWEVYFCDYHRPPAMTPLMWRAWRWLRTALAAIALTGCAQTLPALSSGLDGARQVVADSCPARTTPCERVLDAYNVGIVAYNNALLAQAVGEDASGYEAEGMAALKQLWAVLMQVKP